MITDPAAVTLPSQKECLAVAIVDDDAAVRSAIGRTISNAPGFKLVGEFGDPAAALAGMEQGERPDVVIMDINMPGMSGDEVVRRLKPRMPDVQFVMLTVYEDADNIFKALSAGATGYLLKRAAGRELLTSLRDVCAGGSPMTSQIARKVVQSFAGGPRKPGSEPEPVESSLLSKREQEVLDYLTRGFLYKEIAEALGVGVTTINTYVRRIYEKLHVRSRSQAVAVYAGRDVG
jgi:DNA-binding NarL/FixJ family response regulator